MTTTSSSASSAPRPVVGAAPKMPKVKYSSKVMAHINAFSIAFAIFFGLAAIFAAIDRTPRISAVYGEKGVAASFAASGCPAGDCRGLADGQLFCWAACFPDP